MKWTRPYWQSILGLARPALRGLLTFLKWTVSAVIIVALLAGCIGYLYFRNSLPQVDGTIKVAGLKGPVKIVRDVDGVPHIYAQDKADAFFGLGYVHAQDRLWEMEVWRRITQGRFAEIFGEQAVNGDIYLRTLGLQRAGQSAWEALPPETKAIIDAYTAGVNAFISTHHGSELPPEFTILGITPEPWTSVDSLAWAKIFALSLSSNMGTEILHSDLIQKVGATHAQQLLPGYLETGPSILPALPDQTSFDQSSGYQELLALQSMVQDLSGMGGPQIGAIGSNSWVVDGTKSTTGEPILANDPHLSLEVSGWYVAHLSAGTFDVVGATIPGLPAVVIGRNRSIAWGLTGLNPDVQDLYLEHLDSTGTKAEFQGKMEPMQMIDETIKVRGAPDVHYQVRITRHGPLISDAINAGDQDNPSYLRRSAPLPPLALRWTALDPGDTTAEAFLDLDAAHNWDEAVHALSFLVAPGLNFVYADTSGNIGYYAAAGRVPIRASGDGSVPVAGWTGTNEWTGWVPFDKLPHVYDPPDHYIATANNKPVPDGYPYFLGNEWYPPYRAQRIVDLLTAKEKFSPDDMSAMQGDTVSLQARELLPELLNLVTAQDDTEKRALQILHAWDDDTRADSVAAAIYEVWLSHLPGAVVGDELGRSLAANYQGNFTFTSRFLANTFQDRNNAWCDDVTTPQREDCAMIAQQTFHAALADLSAKLGGDMTSWQWGRLHETVIYHIPFFTVPALRPIFSRSAPNGGDWSTIDMGAFGAPPYSPPSDGLFYTNSFGPSYRQVIDLANLDGGRFIETIGESGHVLSSHYADFFNDWLAIRSRPLRFTQTTVDAARQSTLILEPSK